MAAISDKKNLADHFATVMSAYEQLHGTEQERTHHSDIKSVGYIMVTCTADHSAAVMSAYGKQYQDESTFPSYPLGANLSDVGRRSISCIELLQVPQCLPHVGLWFSEITEITETNFCYKGN